MRGLSLLAIPALAIAGLASAQTPPATEGVSKADFQSLLRARLLKADTDGDGRISTAEWSAAATARGKGRMAGRVFSRVDANGSGFIEPAELDSIAAKRFDKRDADHDGRLSAGERKVMADKMREKAGA